MQIDESDEHRENAAFPILESFEPSSKVTLESFPHSEKHSSQTISTDEGMEIDESDEHRENADGSMRDSFEPGSNLTRESPLHSEKQ
jgi:hypothetical protein